MKVIRNILSWVTNRIIDGWSISVSTTFDSLGRVTEITRARIKDDTQKVQASFPIYNRPRSANLKHACHLFFYSLDDLLPNLYRKDERDCMAQASALYDWESLQWVNRVDSCMRKKGYKHYKYWDKYD